MCEHLDLRFRRRVAMTNRVRLDKVKEAHIFLEQSSPLGEHGALFEVNGRLTIIGLNYRDLDSIRARRRNIDLCQKLIVI